MESIFNSIFVADDILATLVNLFILVFSFDCLLSFANAIKSIKSSIQ